MDIFALTSVLLTTVVFQIQPHSVTASLSKVSMPEICKNMNFCEHKHKYYPEETIERLLKDTDNMYDEYHPELGPRDSDLWPDDECHSVTRMVSIYEIEDLKGNIRFVVQSEKKFKQIIRIDQCTSPGRVTEATKNLSEEIIKNLNLECHQCMLDYKFLVLSLDHESLEAVNVKGGLPVCCSCRMLQDFY